MNMSIWVVDTSNQNFLIGSYTETKFSKNKVVTGKTRFFVIGPFHTLDSVCLILASDRTVLYENVSLLILVLSTKRRYSSLF